MTLSARLAPMLLAGAAAALALMFGACGLNLASAADLNKPNTAAIIDAPKALALKQYLRLRKKKVSGSMWG